jgi:hypothetical protein
MLTMLASGVWHGASGNMMLWGAMCGSFLIIEQLISMFRPPVPPQQRPAWRQGLAMMFIICLVMMNAVPFLMDFSTSLDYWQGLICWQGTALPNIRPFFVIVPALWIDWVQYRNDNEWAFMKWPRFVQAALLAFALLAVFLFGGAEVSEPFIYQGF